MDEYQNIREKLGALMASRQTILGIVRQVDTEKRTCTVEDDGALYYGVRLQCVTGGKSGILIVPALGASILAARIERSENWMAVSCDRAESLLVVAGDKSIMLQQDGIVFNEGVSGMVRLDELIGWMANVYADLNTLASLLKPLGVPFQPTTGIPDRSRLEDTTVKH